MALASSKSVAIAEPLVESAPRVAPWRVAVGRALPLVDVATPPARLRRCTYRKLTPVGARGIVSYSAECLYGGPEHAEPLGDLDAARRLCQGCTNIGIWRADED